MALEDRFEEAEKIIDECFRENRDIITDDNFQLLVMKLVRNILSVITRNDLREGVKHLSQMRIAQGEIKVGIDKLEEKLKKDFNKNGN